MITTLGQPAGFTDFRPLNAWGRAMPRSQVEHRRNVLDLHQVFVETRKGETIPVGPKMMWAACDQLRLAIKQQIILGREKEWGNAFVLQVKPSRSI